MQNPQLIDKCFNEIFKNEFNDTITQLFCICFSSAAWGNMLCNDEFQTVLHLANFHFSNQLYITLLCE